MRQGIKEKDIRDFEKYAQKLSDVMTRIRDYKPEANAFLACGDLHLMADDFHDVDMYEQDDLIVTSICMDGFDGGDF